MEYLREVNLLEVKNFVQYYQMVDVIEISVKENINIEEFFYEMVKVNYVL